MKKIIALLLALTFIFVMFAMTACEPKDNGEGDGTGDGTNAATNGGDKETSAPSNGDDGTEAPANNGDETEPTEDDDEIEPYSIYRGMAAPADSKYFVIDEDHVIHDGKGTWSNDMSNIAWYVFDGFEDTKYDCDEKEEYANGDDADFGIPYEGDESFPTGYVGAWIEEGIYLTAIRYTPRKDQPARMVGGIFQVSVDGTEWVDVYTIETAPETDDGEGYIPVNEVEIDAEITGTAYYYVRYVGPTEGYCNISELEIWGKPAA